MKIGIVVPGFSASESDWCIPAHTDLARALARTHAVHVFALRYPHRRERYRIGDAVVHGLGGAEARGAQSAWLWRAALRAIAQEHRRGRFTALHAIFGGEAGLIATLAGKRLGVPSVVSLVDGEFVGLRDIGYGAELNRVLRWMNALILRSADRLLVGCRAMQHAVEARLPGSRRARVELLPLGVNLARFSPLAPGALPRSAQWDSPALVNVGSLVPVKDQSTLLHAFARFRQAYPGARLVIAGEGPLRAALRHLALDLEIRDAVEFAGALPHDQLPARYRGADLFVQSSRHEGQGMAVLEAGACGAALCGTAIGALADVAAQGAAVCAPVGEPDALAQAMRDAYARCASLGARARPIIEREYNLELLSPRLVELYAQLNSQQTLSNVTAPLVNP